MRQAPFGIENPLSILSGAVYQNGEWWCYIGKTNGGGNGKKYRKIWRKPMGENQKEA